jgi:alkylhydroperoxidase family enzyme
VLISNPPEDTAVAAMYAEDRDQDGYVMNLTRLWAWRPDVDAAFLKARTVLLGGTTLSKREIAVLNVATASRRGDAYCSIAWGTRLAELADGETAGALLRGDETPRLSAREVALARWAELAVSNPNSTAADDVGKLYDAGLSDREIVDATLFVAFRLAFTTVNAALGAQPDSRLAGAAPRDVLSNVTFGRPAASAG